MDIEVNHQDKLATAWLTQGEHIRGLVLNGCLEIKQTTFVI